MGKYLDMLEESAGAAPPGTYMQLLEGPLNQPTGEVSMPTGPQQPMAGARLDSPQTSAGFGATMAAGLRSDPAAKIKAYAEARGIPESAYGIDKGGNIGFLDPQSGAWTLETPSIRGSTGPIDFLQRLGQNIGANWRRDAPQAAALGASIAFPGLGGIPAAVLAAGGTEAGLQATENVAENKPPWELSPGGIAKEAAIAGGGQAIGAGVNLGLRKAVETNPLKAGQVDAQMLSDPNRMAQAAELAREAQSRGVGLTPGNVTGAPTLLNRERQLGRWDETTNKMGEFYKARNTQEVPAAVRDELENISSQGSSALGARDLAKGARETISFIHRRANQASRPAYEAALDFDIRQGEGIAKTLPQGVKAFVDDPLVSDAVHKGITIQRLEHVSNPATRATEFDPKIYGVTRNAETGRYELEGMPNMRTLNVIKKGLDDMIEGYRDSASGRLALDEMGNAINQFRKAFVREIDAVNPTYGTARRTYAELIAPVNEERGGLVPLLAKDRASGFDKTPEQMLGPGADTVSIAKARSLFEQAGQTDAWNAGVRSFLEDRLSDALKATQTGGEARNVAGKFYQSVFGTGPQRANLEAAINDPVKFQSFTKLMDVLQAASKSLGEGSPTATDLGAKGSLAGPVAKFFGTLFKGVSTEVMPRIGGAIEEASARRGAEKLAAIYTNPDAMSELSKLRLVNPNSPAALRYATRALEIVSEAGTVAGERALEPRALPRGPGLNAP